MALMAEPHSADLPAAARFAAPAGIGRRAAPAAIMPPVTHTAITAAPTMAVPIMALTITAAITPLPRFMAAGWRPGSQSGLRLQPPQHEAIILITIRRPIRPCG